MSTSTLAKDCTKCGKAKPASEFYRDRGRCRSDCKECNKARGRGYYEVHRDERIAYWAVYREVNHERVNAGVRAYARRNDRPSDPEYAHAWYLRNRSRLKPIRQLWRKANPEYNRAVLRSRRGAARDSECSLTAGEWEMSIMRFCGTCAYCGEPHEEVTQDHVIPLSKGGQHTRFNVVPACRRCNSRKAGSLTWEMA